MNPLDPATCAWCPRLCRHVCPVAVATGREAVLPSAMFAAVVVARGGGEVSLPEALDLCLGCGACEAHCKHHVPVPARVAALRWENGAGAEPSPVGDLGGGAEIVCVLTSEGDWSGAWAVERGIRCSVLRTDDELGHAAVVAGQGAEHLRRVAAVFAGRSAVTGSLFVAAVLRAAAVPVEVIAAAEGLPRLRTCLEEPLAGCCGRRGGYDRRHPDLAREVAGERVRGLAGEHACGDEGCAVWLRANGASVVSPTDRYLEG